MEIFWRQGYRDASIEDIVQASGLNRYAIYSRVGGKKELFIAALARYHAERKAVFLRTLGDPDGTPLKAISDVFRFAIEEMARRKAGCLMCHVAANRADHDPDIAAYLERYVAEIECAFHEALTAARDTGQVQSSIAPEKAAKLLITMIFGLGIQAKNGASIEDMYGEVESFLKLLARQ